MGFIAPIFHSVGNLPLLSISLKIFSNEGSKKYRSYLIISFRIESMLFAFFVLRFGICSWISFGVIDFRGGSRGRVQGVRTPPPPPEMTCAFLIQLVFCQKKKTMWFIGVEVEQETGAPPPKKNPGSAPGFS